MTPNRARATPNLPGPATGTQTCAHCSELFHPVARHPGQRFCSRACQVASYRRSQGCIPMGTAMAATCVRCGRQFTYLRRKRRRVLCEECR